MRHVGAAHHAAEDRAQPRVGEHLLGEGDEGVMHIVLGYGRGNAVQVSRSQVKEVLSRIIGFRCRVCDLGAGPRRDDDPATVDYLREQAPYSQYNS
jgi:hypothetical protein